MRRPALVNSCTRRSGIKVELGVDRARSEWMQSRGRRQRALKSDERTRVLLMDVRLRGANEWMTGAACNQMPTKKVSKCMRDRRGGYHETKQGRFSSRKELEKGYSPAATNRAWASALSRGRCGGTPIRAPICMRAKNRSRAGGAQRRRDRERCGCGSTWCRMGLGP